MRGAQILRFGPAGVEQAERGAEQAEAPTAG
jgi:hypothetical protein